MSNPVPKIRLRGVRKAFGAKIVLDGIDLDVMHGTSLVVIGGSGSGKSVLLKCLLGIIEPDAATIAAAIHPHRADMRLVQYRPALGTAPHVDPPRKQSVEIYPDFSGSQWVGLSASFRGLRPELLLSFAPTGVIQFSAVV